MFSRPCESVETVDVNSSLSTSLWWFGLQKRASFGVPLRKAEKSRESLRVNDRVHTFWKHGNDIAHLLLKSNF